MEELQKSQKIFVSVLGKIKKATKMVSGWSRTNEDPIIEILRGEFVDGCQKQILELCQAFEELPSFIKGYLLLTTDYIETVRGFEEAITVYYPELEEA